MLSEDAAAMNATMMTTMTMTEEEDYYSEEGVASATSSDDLSSLLFIPYQDGQVIERKWHLGFVFLAYVAAFVGSYTGIRILEHGLWRSEQEKQHATFIFKYPRFAMSLVLGSCAIWSMHFIGMQAEELVGIDSLVCYDWIPTIGSLLLSVTGVWAGVVVAGWDIFAGPDRLEILKGLVRCDSAIVTTGGISSSSARSSNDDHQENHNHPKKKQTPKQLGSYHIHCIAFFDMLHWIAAGSFLAALGALSMHYVGMIAMKGPFSRQWSFVYIAASVFAGVVICFVGFWILFRPLHFKVEKSWYRLASAAIIALAICFLHFFGMFAVTYTYTADASSQSAMNQCGGSHSFQGWKLDQFQVLIVAMVVPLVAFVVEHTISNELRDTYRQLLDIKLSGSEFLEESNDDVFEQEEGGGDPRSATTEGSTTKIGRRKSKKILPPPDEVFASAARGEDQSYTHTCCDLSGVMSNDDLYSHESYLQSVWPDHDDDYNDLEQQHQDVWSSSHNDHHHGSTTTEGDGVTVSLPPGAVKEGGAAEEP